MNWYGSIPKFVIASGLVLLCTGCTGRKEVAIAAKDDTIRRQESLLAQEKADKDSLSDQNKALADQNTQLAEKNAKIAQEQAAQTAALNAKLDAQDQMLKDLGSQFARLQTPQNGSGSVHQGPDGIHLTVAGSALFDAGKAELKPSAHALLMKIANTIKKNYPRNYLRIEGHTDGTPIVHSKEKFKDNMELSLGRATSVYEFLSSQGGIARAKMYTAGYGEHQPVRHPEKTAADRAANRRVEIVIMPEGVKVQKDTLAQASKPVHK
jgi:flagellar motor protein MotB